MEESIANAWLQDSIPLVRTELMDLVYFQESEPSSLQLPNMEEFSPSNPSSLLGVTADHYNSYFGGSYDGLAPDDPSNVSCVTAVTSEASSMSQALEQLLICKDAESQSTWGMQPQLEDLVEEPLHQLPGWITQHDDYMMDDWQQANSKYMPRQAASSSDLKPELRHSEPWNMMDLPAGSCIPPTVEILSPLNHSLHSGMVSSEPTQPTSPLQSSDSSNEVADANKKAAARKNRILLRQKSASHQRGGTNTPHAVDVNGDSVSPRVLKKRFSPKIQREFLMCNHVQGRDVDLRFLLHKVLQPSDVNNLGRIVISKREAETHLPYLATKEGIFITMEDFDTAEQWTFRYRFWPNSRSRMYLFESTGGFVRAHHLKKGDILVLWRDSSRGNFVIRGMEALPCWRVSNGNKQYIESG